MAGEKVVNWSANHPLILTPDSGVVRTNDDPIGLFKTIEQSRQDWIVYFSYDVGRSFERLPNRANDDLELPLIAGAVARPSRPCSVVETRDTGGTPVPRSTFAREEYLSAVQRCIDYIAAGDVFQINLSQRLTAPLTRAPYAIFEHLQAHFPADFPAYFDFGDFQLISNSPELFLRVQQLPDGRRRIINRPIKGTRPRLPGMESELRDSAKDKAELAMIVDLQRNDLGRICEIGSVHVVQPRVIETLPTVYHGVATIDGILRSDVTLTDILRATFPCGSVTGCPKIRAMEIIDELEPVRRGPYCGAIGWIGADGTMELSVAIRTMIVKDGQIHIPVGGGIVADSSPEAEYDETLVKARAMLEAAAIHSVVLGLG